MAETEKIDRRERERKSPSHTLFVPPLTLPSLSLSLYLSFSLIRAFHDPRAPRPTRGSPG
jgi:hypothetical protein